ncbi:MAG: DUF3313 domain-containing protein [Pseudomonas sp.]
MTRQLLASFAVSTGLLLVGCSSSTTQPDQYSGFLPDYSILKPATSASGAPVMRWVQPGLDLNRFSSVMVEKPQFYPKPKPSEQVSQKALNDIADYLQKGMERELAGRLRVVQQPDADTLVLRSAITAVNTSKKDLQFYEVIPIALVVAAATSAAGTRDEDTNIYVEIQALDGETSKPVAEVVRKGTGLRLENDTTQLTLDDLKPVLDVWAKDARNFKP